MKERPRFERSVVADDRVSDVPHYDGDCVGGFLSGARCRTASNNDNVHFKTYQLARKEEKAIVVSDGRTPFNAEVFALDISEVAHSLPKGTVVIVGVDKLELATRKKTYSPNFALLLSE